MKVQADLSFTVDGDIEHHAVVALKHNNLKESLAKWRVLSFMAAMKKGKLFLLVPKGHKVYIQNLAKKHDVKATIHSI